MPDNIELKIDLPIYDTLCDNVNQTSDSVIFQDPFFFIEQRSMAAMESITNMLTKEKELNQLIEKYKKHVKDNLFASFKSTRLIFKQIDQDAKNNIE